MKIGFVFDDSLDKNDGVQAYMAALSSWLVAQGHEVHFLVGETKRTDIPHVHSLARNVKVNFNGNQLSIPLWGSKRRISVLLKKEQFDVLHVQVPYHPLLAGRIIAAAPERCRVVGTFHIAPYSRLAGVATKLLGLWSKQSLRRFDQMVSTSPAAQEFAQRTFGIETTVVPNVFDYERFASAKPLKEYTDNIKTIVFLGRLVPRKGCQILLTAVQMLVQRGVTDFRIVVCGDGLLRAKLEAFVVEHHLSAQIAFVGRISEADKPRYLASADISVFPSSAGESFGIVLVEAMASGKAAVLGGDNPGYRSVLNGYPTSLFDPTNAAQLADSLQQLLIDDAARIKMATWGRQECEQYDVRRVGLKLLEVYGVVAQNNSNTA